MALVEVRGVGKSYGGREVLAGVDLDVHAGEVLGLIGPNGGGKSTLLAALAGLIRPDRGEVRVDGVPAHRLALDRAGSVGLITATPGLYPLLTGRENLHFFGGLYGLRTAEVDDRVRALADALDITQQLNVPAAACSSGQQQKISLLRALLMAPAVLLLDEPTSNLDPLAAHTIFLTARRLADEGRAVIWVTHDLPAAEQICDRVALVSKRVHHIEVFGGPRTTPADSPLLRLWRERLGAA
jgi:ABC-type multidrug transport system ATPase subunit